jgi:hypothetical protein
MRLVRFSIPMMRGRPRPLEYMAEMRACATRVASGWWEFDRDLPCYRSLVDKYREYKATADDVARAEIVKAEERAKRDVTTRKLWSILHNRAFILREVDGAKEAEFLREFDARVPCGDCRLHWREILKKTPPDFDAYFAWTVEVHNAVNRILGKREWTVAEARAAYPARSPS